MPVQFKNYAKTTVASALSSGATVFNVGSSGSFPALTAGQYFYATLIDVLSYNSQANPPIAREIIKVTGVVGNTWTIQRGQDGTVAQSWNVGDVVELRFNAAAVTDLLAVSSTYYVATNFGIVGDGVTDNTAAITAMLASVTSGTIFWPPGTYLTAGGHTVPAGVSFVGSGRNSTLIYATNATNTVFTVSGTYNTIRGIQFTASVVRSAGSYLLLNGNYANVEDCAFWNAFRAITIGGTSINVNTSFFYNGVAGTGAEIEINSGTADIALTSLVMDAPNGSQPLAGVLITFTADVVLHDCNIIHHGSDLMLAPGVGQSIGSVYASQCFFDTAVNGVNVVTATGAQVLRCIFEECWMSSHSNNGIVTSNPAGTINGLDFINCHMFLNTGSGAFISNASNVRFLGGQVAQNGNNGLVFGDAGATGWSVIGMKIGAVSGLTGNVGVGILINAAGIDNFVIQGNNLIGNTVGTISNASTGTNWSITGNVGDAVHPLFQADRLRGDFTTAGLFFQTQVANGLTFIATMPLGAGASSAISAFNSSDPANTSFARLFCNATAAQLVSQKIGTGTLLPLQFSLGGTVMGQFDVNGNLIYNKALAGSGYSKQVPTTGFAITVADNSDTLILDPAGTLATGTITFPLNPIDGQHLTILSTQVVTALTISGNGKTVKNAPTTIAANGAFEFIYVVANTTWYRKL